MERTSLMAVVLAMSLGVATGVSAHEGHTHTVMGTVVKVSPGQIEVQTKDGKAETVVLTNKTVVTRDKVPAKLADVAVGDRLVIDVGTGSKPLKARSIKLGPAAPEKAAPKPKPAS
ncbi:MAG: hypothetical protein ABL971_05445 [Vicinamibacterales bacterium]